MQSIEELTSSMYDWTVLAKLNKRKKRVFLKVLESTLKSPGSRLYLSAEFVQHGNTSVLKHCITVAVMAMYLSQKFHMQVNETELARGALLHDYFLYDWHVKSWANSIHGYTHPRIAMRNASRDFDLSENEKRMILRHMFPLTLVPPTSREALLLCLADKICATRETLKRHG